MTNPAPATSNALPTEIAEVITKAYDAFRTQFQAITRRAARRWGDRDWSGQQFDATERLQAHRRCVQQAVDTLSIALDPLTEEEMRAHWNDARDAFAQDIVFWSDSELAETFFNSVTRRVIGDATVDLDLEFRWFGGIRLPNVEPGKGEVATFRRHGDDTAGVIRQLLESLPVRCRFVDLESDAERLADAVDTNLERMWEASMPVEIDVLRPIFYRNKGAYVVGRIRHLNRVSPLILALVREPLGARVDAAIFDENDVSRLFGFTRAYFHVDTASPSAIVAFVKSLSPAKPVAELYTSLGYNQHGKTQLYRGLRRHLDHSPDRFVRAEGTEGMVMVVFNLPSFDVVFKVIRDSFAPPKKTTRRQVKAKYRLVYLHDRVGRMVDAQEFENLALPIDRFSTEVLEVLRTSCSDSVTITDDNVVLRHVYTERRVYPLDLFLRDISGSRARAAVLDYGQAIKDLSAANIFPGALFAKNFGVTRHGQVVFYDYDELMLLTDCRFRIVPEAPSYEAEMAAEPWFSVEPNDVFPEEFRRYFRFPGELQGVFDDAHDDLSEADFWLGHQRRANVGGLADFFPYPEDTRLR